MVAQIKCLDSKPVQPEVLSSGYKNGFTAIACASWEFLKLMSNSNEKAKEVAKSIEAILPAWTTFRLLN